MRTRVIDSREGDLGLRICIGADIACVRHRTIDSRATGIWEVVASLPPALQQVLDLDYGGLATRPAVVDDFGALVFVGPAQ